MKKAIFVVLIFSLLFSSISVSYAQSNVVEKPNIKININNTIGTYQNVPIIVEGRTLLPLREILVNLGVPHDNQHIIWDNATKSVTV